jgi:CheY-like chemotaxis protein
MSLKNTYDLIFMDLRMDVMDGLEASDIIINKHKNKTPIIAFSGDGSQDIYDECKNIGIVEFISKPAKQNQIYEIINKFVKFN